MIPLTTICILELRFFLLFSDYLIVVNGIIYHMRAYTGTVSVRRATRIQKRFISFMTK